MGYGIVAYIITFFLSIFDLTFMYMSKKMWELTMTLIGVNVPKISVVGTHGNS